MLKLPEGIIYGWWFMDIYGAYGLGSSMAYHGFSSHFLWVHQFFRYLARWERYQPRQSGTWVGFPVRSCAKFWDQNIQKPCKTTKKNHTPCTSIHMQSPNFTEILEREDIKGPIRPTTGKILRSAQLGGPVRGWRNFEYPHQLDEMTATEMPRPPPYRQLQHSWKSDRKK